MKTQAKPGFASEPNRPQDNIRLGIALVAIFSLTIPIMGTWKQPKKEIGVILVERPQTFGHDLDGLAVGGSKTHRGQ